ncbi:MAG TPA: serine hydrolase [Haliangium sp.]|nr:serine hydrolase [Haliangium sp.]
MPSGLLLACTLVALGFALGVVPGDVPEALPEALADTPAAGAPGPAVPDSEYLARILQSRPERFRIALDPALAAGHRIQILVSFVERRGGSVTLERHGFRVGAEYYYPASAIKLCAAVAALGTMRGLIAAGHRVTLDSPLRFHPLHPGERPEPADGQAGGRVTLGRLLRQTLIVSSNEAFNRLYDYAGHQALHETMWSAGLRDTFLFHRLSVTRSEEEHRMAPRIDIETGRGAVTTPTRNSALALDPRPLPGLDVGRAYVEARRVIESPMSFARKNRMSLVDLQNLMIMVMRPDIPLDLPGLSLHRKDRAFLQRALREPPAESRDPVFPPEDHDILRFKPVLGGLQRVAPMQRWAVWNKAGTAYGFRIENAYVVDEQSKRAMFFTVAIYANADGVLNDDEYEYDTVADPFIHDLAEAVVRDRWKLPASASRRGRAAAP